MKMLLIALIIWGCSKEAPMAPTIQNITIVTDTVKIGDTLFSVDTVIQIQTIEKKRPVTITFKLDSSDFPFYNSSRFSLLNSFNNLIWDETGPFERGYTTQLLCDDDKL